MLCFKQHECHTQGTLLWSQIWKLRAFRKIFKENTKKQSRALEKWMDMLAQILCSGSLTFGKSNECLQNWNLEGTSRISENTPQFSNHQQNSSTCEFLVDLVLAPWNYGHLAWWKSKWASEHKSPGPSRGGCIMEGLPPCWGNPMGGIRGSRNCRGSDAQISFWRLRVNSDDEAGK